MGPGPFSKNSILGACMRLLLGACIRLFGACLWSGWVQSMRKLGAKYAETLGCKYAVVGCKSMERLGACLTVGSFALQ